MAPKPSLTQSTLSFAPRRSASSASVKPDAKRRKQDDTSDSVEDDSFSDVDLSDSEIEEREEKDERQKDEVKPEAKEVKTRSKKPSTKTVPTKSKTQAKSKEPIRPELYPSSPKYRKVLNDAKEKMGHMKTIHGEGENSINMILRVFDMTEDYGPCMGVSRMERWERASVLGLNPPSEIRDILSTRQGVENVEYSQCVLQSEVM